MTEVPSKPLVVIIDEVALTTLPTPTAPRRSSAQLLHRQPTRSSSSCVVASISGTVVENTTQSTVFQFYLSTHVGHYSVLIELDHARTPQAPV